MKKLMIPIILTIIVLSACKEVDKLTQFHFNINNEFKIPGSPIASPIDIITPPLATETETIFEQNNTSADLIESISLSEMILSINSPASGDFSFLNDVEIYLNADGLDEVLIAEIHDIPDNVGDSLIMETTGADLREYLIQPEISLRLKTVTDKITTQEYTIQSMLRFFVDAKILGV